MHNIDPALVLFTQPYHQGNGFIFPCFRAARKVVLIGAFVTTRLGHYVSADFAMYQ